MQCNLHVLHENRMCIFHMQMKYQTSKYKSIKIKLVKIKLVTNLTFSQNLYFFLHFPI